jgi:hypothetical protein
LEGGAQRYELDGIQKAVEINLKEGDWNDQ